MQSLNYLSLFFAPKDLPQLASLFVCVVNRHETQVVLPQLLPDILLSARHFPLFDRVSFTAQQHVVDVGVDVVLSIDVIVPVLLRQFPRLVVGPRYVAYLTLDLLQFGLRLADVLAEDCPDEDADEQEEGGDYERLRNLLQQAARYLGIQYCKAVILVPVELYTDDLLHGL